MRAGATFAGRVAIVTGASSGIGAATARALAAAGAHVVLAARRTERLQQLVGDLSATYGIRADVVATDMSSREQIDELIAAHAGHATAASTSLSTMPVSACREMWLCSRSASCATCLT